MAQFTFIYRGYHFKRLKTPQEQKIVKEVIREGIHEKWSFRRTWIELRHRGVYYHHEYVLEDLRIAYAVEQSRTLKAYWRAFRARKLVRSWVVQKRVRTEMEGWELFKRLQVETPRVVEEAEMVDEMMKAGLKSP